MRVSILYFAALRDVVGLEEEQLEVTGTVRDAVQAAVVRHPQLAAHLGYTRVARNAAFAGDGELLQEGDTLALLPPVSGG